MFDSLADQIKHDEEGLTSKKERAIRYSVIGVVSILLFAALYMAVRLGA